MVQVAVRESSYDYETLKRNVSGILSSIDDGLLKNDTRVLIKPNLLAASRPEQAITTHPLVVRAACEYALGMGARVVVGDSPPMGSFEKIVVATGLKEALNGMPVTLKELSSSQKTRTDEKFREVELSLDALEADAIINLPKLKTHSQMTLTLAVKNLFGCVTGTSKAEWHLKVGENRELFAELLVSIYRALPPSLSLIDGILAMEGDGPGTGGRPRKIGVLLGSRNAPSLDEVVCRMVGIEPSELLTNRVSRSMGLTEEPVVDGTVPNIIDFEIPKAEHVVFGPNFLKSLLRRHLTTRPECLDETCELCAECAKMCPAQALDIEGKNLSFDYDRCIRCYCCLEVCPHGALRRRDPLLRRLIKKLLP